MSRRLLFIATQPPYPVESGGSQRSDMIVRAMGDRGEVDLMVVGPGPAAGAGHAGVAFGRADVFPPPPPGSLGMWRLLRPLRPGPVDRLATRHGPYAHGYLSLPEARARLHEAMRSRTYAAIVCRQAMSLSRAGLAESAETPGRPPILLDVDDLPEEILRSRIAQAGTPAWKRAMLRHTLRAVGRLSRRAFEAADYLWIVNRGHRPVADAARLTWLPNIPYPFGPEGPPRPLPPAAASRSVLIVSHLGHQVNREGIDRFVRQVWPRVVVQRPDAALRIAGKGLPGPVAARWREGRGVKLLGFVDDLRAEYARCAFAVAPIHAGSGTNIKVVEALAYGRTLVATPFALRGLGDVLRDGESVRTGDDDRALAEACVALLDDPAERDRLARQGAKQVAEHFGYDAFRRIVADTIDRAIG